MRLLTLAFPSQGDFLAAHDEKTGTLLAHTKTEATKGEALLVEIAFPRLPNRPLVRAHCSEVIDGGLRLRVDDADASTLDFLLKIARGDVSVECTTHREHKRFPSALSVEYTLDGAAAMISQVEDLSAGGCFVRAHRPPAVGAPITLEITVPDETGTVHITGHVAWVRSGENPGFGVEFDAPDSPGGKKLRTILRRALGTGEVDL
jgi:Tfp pilus assembly protein PilZ